MRGAIRREKSLTAEISGDERRSPFAVRARCSGREALKEQRMGRRSPAGQRPDTVAGRNEEEERKDAGRVPGGSAGSPRAFEAGRKRIAGLETRGHARFQVGAESVNGRRSVYASGFHAPQRRARRRSLNPGERRDEQQRGEPQQVTENKSRFHDAWLKHLAGISRQTPYRTRDDLTVPAFEGQVRDRRRKATPGSETP